MKKILTLLVMFLATWSILGAQTPVFGYQAVVRTTDNVLVENTPVDVTITVLNGETAVYSETHENMETDGLGMLNLLVGNGSDITGNLVDVDWTNAVIRTQIQIDGGELVEVTSDVMAAPYALEAMETRLTTERIVEYVQDPETTIADYAQCMAALNNNVPENGLMWEKTRERIINYIMNHRELALEVAVAYLETSNKASVKWVVDHLTPEAMEEAVEVGAQFLIDHRGFAVEVLISYLESSTPQEADEIIDAILAHEDEILPYVLELAKNNRSLALRLVNAFFESATATEVTNALDVFDDSYMKQAFVDKFFYNHLNNYIQPNTDPESSLDDDHIRAYVKDKLDDDYILKEQCDGVDVDICNMRDHVKEMTEE